MTARPVPKRHWRSYGDHPLPTGEQALDEPLRAFPSWFLRIVCDRCGKEQLISEIYLIHGNMLIRDILERMRHAGCGGRAGRAELSPALRAPAAGRCEGSCCGGKPSRWRSDSRESGASLPFVWRSAPQAERDLANAEVQAAERARAEASVSLGLSPSSSHISALLVMLS